MCFGSPSVPEMPKPQPPPPPPPAPPPMPAPEQPLPPPESTQAAGQDVGGVRAAKTKRQANQQAAQGVSGLRIPLGTPTTAQSATPTSLNIPK
jgi:hypothetical protein